MSVREMYAYGRSEGYADGGRDAHYGLLQVHDGVAALEPELRHARDYVQMARSGVFTIPEPECYRAFVVGRARGYRQAAGVGG